MAFFIGIDGGGTKTSSVLTDENLNVLSKAVAAGTNPFVVGVEKSAGVLLSLIKTLIAKKKSIVVEAAVIGLAGCGRKENADAVKKKLSSLIKEEKILIKKVFVLSDAAIALEGAFQNDNGAILIAGTGSIIYGKDKAGNNYRAGGFGKIIGDEGSGYSIGLKGLKTVAEQYDGRGNVTELTGFLKKIGIKDRDTLIFKVYSNKFEIAAIAEYVIRAAGLGDAACNLILQDESNELLHLVKTLKKKMSVRKLKICLLGGLLLTENIYSQFVRDKINKCCAGVTITQPVFKPEIGAVLLAKAKTNF